MLLNQNKPKKHEKSSKINVSNFMTNFETYIRFKKFWMKNFETYIRFKIFFCVSKLEILVLSEVRFVRNSNLVHFRKKKTDLSDNINVTY